MEPVLSLFKMKKKKKKERKRENESKNKEKESPFLFTLRSKIVMWGYAFNGERGSKNRARKKKREKKKRDREKRLARIYRGREFPIMWWARGLNRRGEAVSVVAIGRGVESTLIVNRADCPSAGGVQTSSTKAVIPGAGARWRPP